MKALQVLGLCLCLVPGCVDSLDDLDGTDCTGRLPGTIRLVDPEVKLERPCSIDEAIAYDRAQTADIFRENSAGVRCLLKEAITTCVEEPGDERTLFVCKTSHPAPELDGLFPLTSVIIKPEDCPE